MDRRGFEAGTDGSAEGERKRPCSRCGDSSLFLDADSRLPAARTARERNKVAPEVLSKTPTLITKGKLCSFFFFSALWEKPGGCGAAWIRSAARVSQHLSVPLFSCFTVVHGLYLLSSLSPSFTTALCTRVYLCAASQERRLSRIHKAILKYIYVQYEHTHTHKISFYCS
jgi:hypothetical protein